MNWDNLDTEVTLWRYMDFSKFVDLILSEKIYLSSLKGFEDVYEGYISNPHRQKNADYVNTMSNWLGYSNNPISLNDVPKDNNLVYFAYANCWHNNKFESAAMWKLYARTNEAIAIKTNLGRLIDSVKPASPLKEEGILIVKKMYYVDLDDEESFPDDYNPLQPISPLFVKRKSFEHENEIRLSYIKNNNIFPSCHPEEKIKFENMSKKELEEISKNGVSVDVDLKNLIEKIYIAPDAPSWFFEMVKTFLAKLNLKDIECEKSLLYQLK